MISNNKEISNQEHQERLMIEWGKKNGVKWDEEMMEIHDFGDSGGGRGVIAKRTIESGDLLVEVPLSLLIHSLPILSVVPPFEHIETVLKLLDSKQTICFQLIYERLIRNRSRWYGYLDCIPKEYNTTVSYTDAEIGELSYPYYKNEATKLRKEMLDSHKQYKEILQSHLTLKVLSSHSELDNNNNSTFKSSGGGGNTLKNSTNGSTSLHNNSTGTPIIRNSGSIKNSGSFLRNSSSDIGRMSASGTNTPSASTRSLPSFDYVKDDQGDILEEEEEHRSHLGCPTNNGYEVVFHQDVLANLVDLNMYVWAWGVIQTRTYYYNPRLDHQVSAAASSKKQQQQQLPKIHTTQDKNDNACLVPLADLFNHNPNVKTMASYCAADRCYRVYTDTRFEKGEQVFISYGLHNNATLLHYYGFVIDNNHLDGIEIDSEASLPPLRPSAFYHLPAKEQREYERLVERKENILIQNGLSQGKYEVVNDPTMPFTWNYLTTLRVMMMTKSEIDANLQNHIFHLDEPVSLQNNKRVSKFLTDLCDRHLLQLGAKRDQSTCTTHNQLMTTILINNTITIFENARIYSLSLDLGQ
ncbi:hypothetical protein DFA_10909 [Cavenderia fasciculata]|uniref:SET domain-containing protein n=1 Tax=Cavenderia fasciculata TaxID=261658 RepID=F4QBR3_CACFS|nr:uncharacterized protein DFA_10909 [Cavenderia fasciculata]EGG14651.1 hypothetical protein DFA_10909 [Cavenderia fasciculata]|eukprot:XP_004351159.1 hypothetical protein DFA_10909 [Cavenderia fasciculata]